MIISIDGKVDYELENSDINEVEVDFENAIEEINNAINATLQDKEYMLNIKEDLKTDDIILNDIIEVAVDFDYIYCKLDLQTELTDEEIINTFKPIIEDIISNSDTFAFVQVSGEVTRDSWNYYKDEYDEESEYETWDDTLCLNSSISNCKVKREEK